MTRAELKSRMAVWAENKADYWSESDKPWALRNMRLYQNYASRYWSEYFAEKRKETES